jgi:hypothetical protein
MGLRTSQLVPITRDAVRRNQESMRQVTIYRLRDEERDRCTIYTSVPVLADADHIDTVEPHAGVKQTIGGKGRQHTKSRSGAPR